MTMIVICMAIVLVHVSATIRNYRILQRLLRILHQPHSMIIIMTMHYQVKVVQLLLDLMICQQQMNQDSVLKVK